MYANCSTTAQRGALDWWKRFRDVTLPVFNESIRVLPPVKNRNVQLILTSQPDYREKLEEELKALRESEMWQAGKTVRSLRPENQAKPAVVSATTAHGVRQKKRFGNRH